MLILGSLSLFAYTDWNDSFIKLITQSNLFHLNNNDMYHLRKEMKKLISTLVFTYRYCQSMRMTGEAKPSEAEAAESDLSLSVIPVDESKEEEKTLVLSSVLAELDAYTKEKKQILGNCEEVEKKQVEEKDVSEDLIPTDDTKKKW